MPISPSTLNYYIGKGNVSIKLAGEADYRHVGNVPEFEFTPTIETLEHFSAMAGTRSRDREVVIEKGGEVRIVFEEFTPENLALALLGDLVTNTDGDAEIDIFSQNSLTGAVRFVGTNEIGSKMQIDLNNVQFTPSGSVGLISDEWGQIELTGQSLVDGNGKFGKVIFLSDEATA